MYNYEHEIKDIRNRKLKYFLYSDYFHDSLISRISIENEGKKVVFILSCEREWPEYNMGKYAEDENYIYKLSFINCAFIEYERNNKEIYTEYINGRFKNSAKLKEIKKGSKGNYYHLRIQLAGGYIDLIFKEFEIEKFVGEIIIPSRNNYGYYFDWIKEKYKEVDINEIINNAACGDFPLKNQALEYLWLTGQDDIKETAMKALLDEDAIIPAIFIIGEIGDIEDGEKLRRIYTGTNKWQSIERRHIKDAIEKILFRM